MKTTITIVAITVFAIGLFIQIGWLALVVLPVVLLFFCATVAPLVVDMPQEDSAETVKAHSLHPAFGD